MERVGVGVERMLVAAAKAGPLSTAALRVSCMPRGLAACVGGWTGRVHARGVSSSNDDAGATTSSGAQEVVTTSDDVALFSWGRGESGVLGHASDKNEHVPRVLAWQPSVEVGETLRITAGLYHCAAFTQSRAWLWGRGSGGRLGQGDEEWAYEPQLNVALAEHARRSGGLSQIALGGLHSAAVLGNGQLFTWGHGGFGALGQGGYKNKLVPTLLDPAASAAASSMAAMGGGTDDAMRERPANATELKWGSVACGGAHTLALTREGQLYAWGRDEGEGRLGLPADTENMMLDKAVDVPTRVRLKVTPAKMAAGGFHSLALSDAGELVGWGGNRNGELGQGTVGDSFNPVPIVALAGHRLRQVAANGFFSAALTEAGEVYTWGSGKHGCLGHGDFANALLPKRVEALVGEKLTSIALGGTSMYAVTQDGRLFVWGSNNKSQLGIGFWTADEYSTPQQVPMPGVVIAVVAGAAHGLAMVRSAP